MDRLAFLREDELHYVRDTRSTCGNCVMWWAKNRAGYVCGLDSAGLYSASEVRRMRETDVPYPQSLIEPLVVRHVRADDLPRETRDAAAGAELLASKAGR